MPCPALLTLSRIKYTCVGVDFVLGTSSYLWWKPKPRVLLSCFIYITDSMFEHRKPKRARSTLSILNCCGLFRHMPCPTLLTLAGFKRTCMGGVDFVLHTLLALDTYTSNVPFRFYQDHIFRQNTRKKEHATLCICNSCDYAIDRWVYLLCTTFQTSTSLKWMGTWKT
jgi:hypothetical protein